MTIGERVKYCRIEKGMTQSELATKLGYKSKSSVAHIENGRDIPRSMVVKLANILGTTPSHLMGWDNSLCSICDYDPALIGFRIGHEEYHNKWKKAIDKFGFYYNSTFRHDQRGKMDDILNSVPLPSLDKQIECQIEKLKCYFSESLSSCEYDLRHCDFNDYVAMMLGQKKMCTQMTDECKNEMIKIYGQKEGIPIGKFYQIPESVTPIIKSDIDENQNKLNEYYSKLNSEGQSKLLDYADDLVTSGKYKKSDTNGMVKEA